MQPPSGIPRAAFSTQQIQDLLQTSPSILISYGADLLDIQLNFVSDLTPYMVEGSSISHANYATIHGTCTLIISSDAPINILNQLVRPWMKVKDVNTGLEAQFYLGVYTLTSPEIDNSTNPANLSYSGYDLLYFLNQPVGDSVEFLVGTNPVDACIDLIGQALPNTHPTINEAATTATLTTDMIYPFDENDSYTYLAIINDLLSAVGYMGVWMDWFGVFQLVPYVSPVNRAPEWTFDLTAKNNIIAEQRTSDQDVFDVPNYWVFIMNGITSSPVEGTNQYTYIDMSGHLTSYLSRQYFVKSINFVDATDYDAMVVAAQVTIDTALNPTETFNVTSSPFPLAWHFDQIIYIDPNIASSTVRHVQAQSWELPLDGTQDMSWIWEAIS